MPRQRRRRRRPQSRVSASTVGAPLNGAISSDARSVNDVIRPWWKPTLGVVFAFSLGLWLGGTASVADAASSVALAVGALGVAIASARLLRNRLYSNRLRALRERRVREEPEAD